MKTNPNAKFIQAIVNPAGLRVGSTRTQSVRALEHRYERRKIREQLRRLDWALNLD